MWKNLGEVCKKKELGKTLISKTRIEIFSDLI